MDQEDASNHSEELTNKMISVASKIINEVDGIILQDYNKGLLNRFSIPKFLTLASENEVPTKNRGQITKFNLPKGRSAPKRFYEAKLDTIPNLIDKAYRTYFLREMTQVRLLDYDIKKIVGSRFIT